MEVLCPLQVNLQRKIENSWVNFEKRGIDNVYGIGARVRLEHLEVQYKEFSANHRSILSVRCVDLAHRSLSVVVEESFIENNLKFFSF